MAFTDRKKRERMGWGVVEESEEQTDRQTFRQNRLTD